MVNSVVRHHIFIVHFYSDHQEIYCNLQVHKSYYRHNKGTPISLIPSCISIIFVFINFFFFKIYFNIILLTTAHSPNPIYIPWHFNLLSLFWENKRRLMRSPRCLCVCFLLTFECLNQSLWSLIYIIYISAPEPISAAYFINPSHQPLCLRISLTLLGNGSIFLYYTV
jgi:hypothetical protein